MGIGIEQYHVRQARGNIISYFPKKSPYGSGICACAIKNIRIIERHERIAHHNTSSCQEAGERRHGMGRESNDHNIKMTQGAVTTEKVKIFSHPAHAGIALNYLNSVFP